jgi:hypothetical protein
MARMQGKGRGVKKIGGHKVIHGQGTEMVICVYSFMKKEGEATGVSLSTLKCILKEYEHKKCAGKEFSHLTQNSQEEKLKLMWKILTRNSRR